MSATAVTPAKIRLARRKSSWADFRLIPRIETFPRVVAFAQTVTGKLVLLAAFGLGLRFFDSLAGVLQLLLPLALITFMPEYRRFVLALAPLCLLMVQPDNVPLVVGLKLGVVAAGISCFGGPGAGRNPGLAGGRSSFFFPDSVC